MKNLNISRIATQPRVLGKPGNVREFDICPKNSGKVREFQYFIQNSRKGREFEKFLRLEVTFIPILKPNFRVICHIGTLNGLFSLFLSLCEILVNAICN